MITIILFFISLLSSHSTFPAQTKVSKIATKFNERLGDLEEIKEASNKINEIIKKVLLSEESKNQLQIRLKITEEQIYFITDLQFNFKKYVNNVERYYTWKNICDKTILALLEKIQYVEKTQKSESYLPLESMTNDLITKTKLILLLQQQYIETLQQTRKKRNISNIGKLAVISAIVGGGMLYGKSRVPRLYAAIINMLTPVLPSSPIYSLP